MYSEINFSHNKVSGYVYYLMAVIGLFIASQINIPIHPVPVNMATIVVMTIGLTYSVRDALLGVLSYVALGSFGLPIFNHFNSGILYLLGPSGGYIVGYIIAATTMALLRDLLKYDRNKYLDFFFLCLIGQFAIYSCGIGWLTYIKDLSFAIEVGLLPFILPGIFKTIILLSIVRFMRSWY